MRSWLIGSVLIAAILGAAVMLAGERTETTATTGVSKVEKSGSPTGKPSSQRPPSTGGPNQSAASTAKFAGSALHREFSQAKDYFALYKSLESRTDAEALFYKASILERCQRVAGNPNRETPEQRIKRFNDSTTGNFRDIRQAINAKFVAESAFARCTNFTAPISEADVNAAYDAAAKAGDIRGQLDKLHRSLLSGADRTLVPAAGIPGVQDARVEQLKLAGPTGAEVALLKQALASKDPSQIEAAGPLLSAEYGDFELKFGDGDGLARVPHSFLWKSVACHYAGGCGADSYHVQLDCVVNARCDVLTFDEGMQRYIFSDADWQNFLRYRATLINAIDTQDWSLLQERRGPRTNLWRNQITPISPGVPRFNLRYY